MERFKQNEKNILQRFITIDETCIHHYAPETKEQSKQGISKGESAAKKGGIKIFLSRLTRSAKSAQDAGPRVQAPMPFLLALVVSALCTSIELPRLHHQGDE